EADQLRIERISERLGDLGLADTRRPFNQEGLSKRHRQVQRCGDCGIRDIGLPAEQLLDISYLFSHIYLTSRSLASCSAARRKSSRVLMSSGKGRSNGTTRTRSGFASTSFHAALSPCSPTSLSNSGFANNIGWPFRP